MYMYMSTLLEESDVLGDRKVESMRTSCRSKTTKRVKKRQITTEIDKNDKNDKKGQNRQKC